MKKILKSIIIIITAAACLYISACSQKQLAQDSKAFVTETGSVDSSTQTSHSGILEAVDNAAELSQDEISDADYAPYLSTYSFNTIEELYQGLRDFNSDELQDIRRLESYRMEDTQRRTHVTDDELENGIFGDLLIKLLKEGTVMVPYYQGREIPCDEREGITSIMLSESGDCWKPWIGYFGKIGDDNTRINTMYYDRTLLDEANEKGASWLLNQIDPTVVNIHNYEKYNSDSVFINVYEKVIRLSDRDVKAMVIEYINTADVYTNDEITIYFVYDDILVCALGYTKFMETILPDITFQEVSLVDNKPIREEPGREGTKYSIRNIQNNIDS